jgi:uncharacterized protein YggE
MQIKTPPIVNTIIPFSTMVILTMFMLDIAIMSHTQVSGQEIVYSEEKPSISVIGEAEKKIPSDETKVSLAVENTAANANLARKDNAEKMDKIVSSLMTNGLSKENITTSNFEIRPNYDSQNNNFDKIISYTAINWITVTCSTNENISSFIDLAVTSGANRVDTIEFATSKKALSDAFKELLGQAFDDAKQKAEILSIRGNFSLNGVKNIDITQNIGYNPPIPYYSFDQNRLASNVEKSDTPPTQIIPQENKLIVNLPVTFFLDKNGIGENKNQTQ